MATPVIIDICIIFLAALIGGLVAERLRQSPVVGYILGGILVGPYVMGMVGDLEVIQDFSEIGVILLMFTLGIEFSLTRLEKVRRVAVLGGVIQIAVTILIGMGVGYAAGLSLYHALFLGCVVSISSTMIVLKALGDQGEVNSLHGQVMLGILIVQDLAVILMVSLLPELREFSLENLPILLFSLARSLAFVLVMVYLARKVVPVIMNHVAQSSNTDAFLILALTMGIGVAVLSHAVGLSLSLGAFLAGLVISESEYVHEIVGKIVSLRDAMVILFFVAVGMLVNPTSLFRDWVALVILLSVIMPVKFLILFSITRMFGYHSRIAFYVGMGMMQTGEFSFVLAKLGMDNQLIPPSLYNLILASSILTIVFTPLFISAAPRWYYRLREMRALHRLFPEPDLGESEVDVTSLDGHVIICGFGRVGHNIGAALQQLGLKFICIDYDYLVIKELSNRGIPFVYGDASNEMVLLHARPDRARLAVVALPDVFSNRQAVHNLLKINPSLVVLARAHSQWEKEILYQQGATEVVQPEMEAGLQMVRHIILHMNLPADAVDRYLETLYIKEYHDIMHKKVQDSMRAPALKVREYAIGERMPLAGTSLLNSGIRESTGCNVVTIKKANGEVLLNPSSDEVLEAGDLVIVMGTSSQLMEFARMYGDYSGQ